MPVKIADLTFPTWLVQFGNRRISGGGGRTDFAIYEILSASTKDGADVGLVFRGSWKPYLSRPNRSEKHLSYAKFRKLSSVNEIHEEMKKNIIQGVFSSSSEKIR